MPAVSVSLNGAIMGTMTSPSYRTGYESARIVSLLLAIVCDMDVDVDVSARCRDT